MNDISSLFNHFSSRMEAVQFDLESKTVSFVQVPIPTHINEDDVLVKVAYAGICGTDLHITEGHFPCSEKPIILGHEFSGIVQTIGVNVTHVKVGDKVSVDPNRGCGKCNYCTDSNYHYCKTGGLNSTIGIYQNGGWAQYSCVPAIQVYKIPDGISLQQAALTEPISCIAHGWDRIQPLRVGMKILIMGAGIIGSLWACILHLQGHRRVIISEPQEGRRKLVANLDTGYNIISPNELQEYKKNPDWGVDLVIDCSGFGPAIQEAVELLNPGGQLCIFGVAPEDTKISVSPYLLFKRELKIHAINVNPYCFNKSLSLIEAMGTRYLDYNKLGIKLFTLRQHKDAISALKEGSIAKAVFKVY